MGNKQTRTKRNSRTQSQQPKSQSQAQQHEHRRQQEVLIQAENSQFECPNPSCTQKPIISVSDGTAKYSKKAGMHVCKQCKIKEVAASAVVDFDNEDIKQAQQVHSVKHLAYVQKDTKGQIIISDGLFDCLGVKDKGTQDRMMKDWTVLARRILRSLESSIKAQILSGQDSQPQSPLEKSKIKIINDKTIRLDLNSIKDLIQAAQSQDQLINIVAQKVSKDVIAVLIEDRMSQGKLSRLPVQEKPLVNQMTAQFMDNGKEALQRDTCENLAAQICELTESTERSSESGRVTTAFNPQNSVDIKIDPNWKNMTEQIIGSVQADQLSKEQLVSALQTELSQRIANEIIYRNQNLNDQLRNYSQNLGQFIEEVKEEVKEEDQQEEVKEMRDESVNELSDLSALDNTFTQQKDVTIRTQSDVSVSDRESQDSVHELPTNDFGNNFCKVVRISDQKFVLKHEDPSQDTEVNVHIEEDDVEFEGLPNYLQLDIERQFKSEDRKNFPDTCLYLLLKARQDMENGLRPAEEIKQTLGQNLPVHRQNPALKYAIKKILGKGGQARIFRVERLSDGASLALKLMTPLNDKQTNKYLEEFRLFSAFDSEQILKCQEVFVWQKKIYAFLDLMEGGAITNIIVSRRGGYSEEFCKYSLYQVALGLNEMHAKNVLHRDIKSDNILCSPEGEIKISDLGFSTSLSQEEAYRRTRMGTAQWVSPEIIDQKPYSKEVDIWAYGIFAFELATGLPPFQARKGVESLFNTVKTKPIPRIPDKWSDDFADFVSKCLDKSAQQRWTIEQLLGHPWMQGANECKQTWISDFQEWRQEPMGHM